MHVLPFNENCILCIIFWYWGLVLLYSDVPSYLHFLLHLKSLLVLSIESNPGFEEPLCGFCGRLSTPSKAAEIVFQPFQCLC